MISNGINELRNYLICVLNLCSAILGIPQITTFDTISYTSSKDPCKTHAHITLFKAEIYSYWVMFVEMLNVQMILNYKTPKIINLLKFVEKKY